MHIRKPVLLWWMMFYFFVGITLFLWKADTFGVSEVACIYNQDKLCDGAVLKELSSYQKTRLWLIQPDLIRAQLDSLLPSDVVTDVRVNWNTRRVYVYLESVSPLLHVAGSSTGPGYGLSAQKRVVSFEPSLDGSYPVMIVGQMEPLEVGSYPTLHLYSFAVDLVQSLSRYALGVDEIRVLSDEEIVLKIGDKSGIVRSSKSAESQVRALQLILATATIEPSLRIIDVRFDQPVIKPYR